MIPSLTSVVILALAVLCTISLIVLARDLLSPLAFFIYGVLLFFVVRPLLIVNDLADHAHPSLLTGVEVEGAVTFANVLILIGVGIVIVAFVTSKHLARGMAHGLPSFDGPIGKQWICAVTTVLACCTLLLYALTLSRYGTWSGMMILARQGRLVEGAVLLMFAQNTTMLAVLCVAGGKMAKDRLVRVFGLFAAVVGIGVGLSLGDRSVALIFLLLYIIVHHMVVSRLSAVRLATYGLVAVTVLFVLSTLRGVVFSRQTTGEIVDVDSVVGNVAALDMGTILTKSLNLSAYDQFVVIANKSSLHELHGGRDFVLGMIGPVPRFLWEGKPVIINTGVWFADRFYGRRDLGMPLTAPGDWILNFGILGMVIGMYATGLMLRTYSEYGTRLRSLYGVWLFGVGLIVICPVGLGAATPIVVVKNFGVPILVYAIGRLWQ